MENDQKTANSQFSTLHSPLQKNVVAEKSKQFAVRIIRFYKYLCSEQKEFVLSKQILRSGTSIGANVRESRNAQSKADFISKMSIALKEADETAYWLELLKESETIDQKQFKSLYDDVEELIRLLTTIIKTAKSNS
ncbi:MAG TPA: four helix bundle protein [Chloroflexi bacterium]|nr:four helix bundle protein [Chloroflexota bacterium]